MLKKIFGSVNDRYIKKLMKKVYQVNALEPEMEKLRESGLTYREIGEKFGLSKQRVWQILNLENVNKEEFTKN